DLDNDATVESFSCVGCVPDFTFATIATATTAANASDATFVTRGRDAIHDSNPKPATPTPDARAVVATRPAKVEGAEVTTFCPSAVPNASAVEVIPRVASRILNLSVARSTRIRAPFSDRPRAVPISRYDFLSKKCRRS